MTVGSDLGPREYHDILKARGIPAALAFAAGLRKVDQFQGQEILGRKKDDCSGLGIPYIDLHDKSRIRAWRIKLANPKIDALTGKPKAKYLGAAGEGGLLYIPAPVTPQQAQNVAIPILITEGELKVLACHALASERTNGTGNPPFIAIGFPGVNNFLTKIGDEPQPDGSKRKIVGLLPDMAQFAWLHRKVIIAYDSDVKTKWQVRRARHLLRLELLELGAEVGFLEWKPEYGKGIDDWLVYPAPHGGPDVVSHAIDHVDFSSESTWRAQLLYTDTGKPKALIENARIALTEHPTWKDNLYFDQFSQRLLTPKRPWEGFGPWTDRDDIELACWLQREGIEVKPEAAAAAALVASRPCHAGQDWLTSLIWDGIPRIDSWLIDYLKCNRTDGDRDITNYLCAVGRAWLIGGIARMLDPGCQMDYCLVLVGEEQGTGKSSALKALAHGWATTSIRDIRDKDASTTQLAGNWIVVFDELEALSKADLKQLKSYLTSRDDNFRSAYGHRAERVKRSQIFCGTTNDPQFLEDTQNRRFWPVAVPNSRIDVNLLERDHEQLWAEALELYRAGEKPYLQGETILALATEQQERYRADDPWLAPIDQYLRNDRTRRLLLLQLDDDTPLRAEELLEHVIKKERGHWADRDIKRIARILSILGYTSYQVRRGASNLRAWRPKVDSIPPD